MANFRETNWFKRGELVDGEPDDKVELPIEDRYLDAGDTTSTDSVLYGVHTGETTRVPSLRMLDTSSASDRADPEYASTVIACDPSSARDLQKLIRELKTRNRAVVAMCGAAMLAVAAFVSTMV